MSTLTQMAAGAAAYVFARRAGVQPTLGDLATGRDNNFNLVRVLAALAVLVSHSFPLARGVGSEPFHRIGYTLGGMGVDVFFVVSGFLVTMSLQRIDHVGSFVRARALRIYPALVVMSVAMALLFGPAITTLPLAEYFVRPDTWEFVLKNATVLTGLRYRLPGVFEGLPMAEIVNGSLWTLPFELRCYALLALAWWLAARMGDRDKAFHRIVIISSILMLCGMWVALAAGYKHWHGFRLFFMFASGSAFWLMRHRVPVTARWFWTGVSLVVLTVLLRPSAFFWIYPLAIGYLALWVALVPRGAVRGFNRIGDYSYGIYIYAFPMQQLAVAWLADASPWKVMAISLSLTVPLAVLSWHLVEAPMLRRKERSVRSDDGHASARLRRDST